MEKDIETTVVYWGLYWGNGKFIGLNYDTEKQMQMEMELGAEGLQGYRV